MNEWEIPTATLGAGALLLHKDHVLLVRVNYGKTKGQWILPGGRVERGERLEDAVLRELAEESGVPRTFAHVEGMLAARHRLFPEGRADVYFVFLVRARNPQAAFPALKWPEEEIIEARFWPVAEALRAHEAVRPVTRAAIEKALSQGPLYCQASHQEGFLPEDTLYCGLK